MEKKISNKQVKNWKIAFKSIMKQIPKEIRNQPATYLVIDKKLLKKMKKFSYSKKRSVLLSNTIK